jgi:hypothetical protein
MFRVVEYSNRFQGVRTGFGGLPSWARGVVFLAALPGPILIALSFLAVLVSLLALLLLAVPAYRLMQWVTGTGQRPSNASDGEPVTVESGGFYGDSPGRKRVEATIVDPSVADRAAD